MSKMRETEVMNKKRNVRLQLTSLLRQKTVGVFNKAISYTVLTVSKKASHNLVNKPLRYFAHASKHFIREWTRVLLSEADIYTGLYSGIAGVSAGTVKNSDKTLKEWYDRTRYNLKDEKILMISESTLKYSLDNSKPDEYLKWSKLLLKSISKAGIIRDEEKQLILTDTNVNAYVEWDDQDLYAGDSVEIIMPAWYQQGRIIEQGSCKLIKRDRS